MPKAYDKELKQYILDLKEKNPNYTPMEVWRIVNEDDELLERVNLPSVGEHYVREVWDPEIKRRRIKKQSEANKKRRREETEALKQYEIQNSTYSEPNMENLAEPDDAVYLPNPEAAENRERFNSSLVHLDDLTTAILEDVTSRGHAKPEEAELMAEHLLNFFGYEFRIIDNILEPEDRDVFYMLEDSGLLTTEREETTLYDGREWRIHYWLFRKDRIVGRAERADKKKKEQEIFQFPGAERYEELADEAWARAKTYDAAVPNPSPAKIVQAEDYKNSLPKE